MALNLNLSKAVSIPSSDDSSQKHRRLLIVDDEPMLLEVLASIFSNVYNLRTAESGEAALQVLESGFLPEVIIADQRMPGLTGAQFLAKSIGYTPQAVRVVLTGYTDVQDIIDSINLGNVYRFLTKPWQRSEILEAVRLCFEHYDIATRHAELAEAHKLLNEAHENLTLLTMEKDEFLGIAAHDLKNPIGGIRGLAEMLLMYRDDLGQEQMNEMLQSIIDSSERMFELIKNLLDVNALERGGMPIHLIDFDLAMPVFLIAYTYRQRAVAKNITLHYEHSEGFMVVADEQAVMQVLDNLVSNAVKYSPEGKNIYLGLKKGHSSNDTNAPMTNAPMTNNLSVRFEVQDEGPGLSDDDKTKLFGKFARLSAQPTGGEHSTGLGLSIVKKMVEAMNGKVWCESELDKGATFIVELPAAEQNQ